MELTKTKYKQTEIGLLPEDWEVKQLREVVTYKNGAAHENCVVDNGDYVIVNSKFVSTEGRVKKFSNENRCPVNKDEVLMVLSDVPNGKAIAKCFYVNENNRYTLNQRICSFKSDKVDSKYLFLILNRNPYYLQFDDGVKQTNLRNEDVLSCPIPLPPNIHEQKAIAKAISDVDDLIANLDKLITKKKAIKQGAMQQLLTPPNKGGKRLDGFTGEWVETPLDDVAWYQEGPGLRKWQFTDKGIKAINITNLVNGYLDLDKTQRHISWDEFNKMYQHFEIDENDILVASSGNSYCKTAVVRKQDLRLVMNTSVIRFKPKENLDYKLLLIFLKSSLFKDQIDLLITGGAQPNFGPAHLRKIHIMLPPTKDEQSSIANILYDMEMEIEELSGKKGKYQDIKQGMMQELLTGKTRLI